MIVESNVNVVDNFTASKVVFHQGMSVVRDAHSDLLSYDIYQDDVSVVCNDGYSMVFDGLNSPMYIDTSTTSAIVKPSLNFNLICNNDSIIIRDQSQDEFQTGIFQHYVNVSSTVKPDIEEINGVKFISIECQLGVYFEVEIDALATAISVFSLPQGMKTGGRKIYGTPMYPGVYKSYLEMPSDYIIEVEFKIDSTIRIL